MIGLIIGVLGGLIQLYLLIKLANGITGGGITSKTILLCILQLFIPMAILLCVAFIRRSELLYTGIGLAAVLIAGAVIRLFIMRKRKNGGAGCD